MTTIEQVDLAGGTDANILHRYEPIWTNMAHPGAWRQVSFATEAIANVTKRIHIYMYNPDCNAWYMGVDIALDIPGRNNPVVFQEDGLQMFQHVSGGAWALPIDCY